MNLSERSSSGIRASTSYAVSTVRARCLQTSCPRRRHARRVMICWSTVEEFDRTLPEYSETEKERSRRYRRTVFTHDDWFKHRSTERYQRHISGLVGSRIVRGLAVPISGVVLIAWFVTVYEVLREEFIAISAAEITKAFENGSLPPYCLRLTVDSSEPFNLTSFALSLLLVFRTNASYARWLDARKAWAGIGDRCRDIVRQGLTWMSPDKKALKDMLQRWVTAFPVALKCHLTFASNLEAELQGILRPHEVAAVAAVDHRPLYVTRVISEIISAAKLTDSEVFLMDTNLTFFMDAVGSCERIFSTPIPLSWTRHTSRFLVIWLGVLPFLLFSTCRWATVPVSAIISLLMLGIEEIGVQIEEPFSILPLDHICADIASNVREMHAQKDGCEVLIQQQIPMAVAAAPLEGLPAGNLPDKLTSDLDASSFDIPA